MSRLAIVLLAHNSVDTIYLDAHKGTTAVDGVSIFGVLLRWKLGTLE